MLNISAMGILRGNVNPGNVHPREGAYSTYIYPRGTYILSAG